MTLVMLNNCPFFQRGRRVPGWARTKGYAGELYRRAYHGTASATAAADRVTAATNVAYRSAAITQKRGEGGGGGGGGRDYGVRRRSGCSRCPGGSRRDREYRMPAAVSHTS